MWVPTVPSKSSEIPIEASAPRMPGEDNEWFYRNTLGISQEEYEKLCANNII